MTATVLPFQGSESKTDSDGPTEAEKVIIDAYANSLKVRGFCKITTDRETMLYNRFDDARYSLTSYIEEDFSSYLYQNVLTCKFRSPKYIALRLQHIVGTRFMPKQGIYYRSPESGSTWVNTYKQYKPSIPDADVSPLLPEFFERLWPDPVVRHTCCVFRRNWTPVPPQTGHPVQRKLDTCSRPNWTLRA